MAIAFLLVTATLFIAGIGLIVQGRRGRVIDDHPICRKCGFDLIGLPSDSHRCSECGADLHARRAIVKGHRKRRARPIIVGAATIIVALGFASLMLTPTFASLQRVGFAPIKPVWLLLSDARSNDRVTRTNAFRELHGRIKRGALGADTVLKIVDDALTQQQSPTIWNPEWGDLIELARSKGILDDTRWQRYVRDGVRLTLTVRPRVRRGDPIPYRLAWDCRYSSNGLMALLQAAAEVDAIPDQARTHASHHTRTRGHASDQFVLSRQQVQDLNLGEHRLNLGVSVYPQIPATVSREFHKFERLISAPWTLVNPDEETVTPIPPSDADASEIKFRVELKRTARPDHLFGTLQLDYTPYPLAFQVFAKTPGNKYPEREWPLCTVTVPAAGRLNQSFVEQLDGLSTDQVTLIFRPSPDVARRTVDMTQYWNGTIEIKDVPIGKQ